MTKSQLLETITAGKDKHESFYLDNGPDKHEQEEHYADGLNVIRMNLELLESWLEDGENGDEAIEAWHGLSVADQRELWEASGFHFGIMGYDAADADYFWDYRATKAAK